LLAIDTFSVVLTLSTVLLEWDSKS